MLVRRRPHSCGYPRGVHPSPSPSDATPSPAPHAPGNEHAGTPAPLAWKSPLALAALATVALPGLDVWHAFPIRSADGYQAAVAVDSESRQWVVRLPRTAAAGATLEAEVAFLQRLEPAVDSGELPFVVPRVAGSAPLIGGGRAIVYPRVTGNQLRLEAMRPGPGAAASLGRAIAALHSLPLTLVEACGLPVYSAQQHRERRLAELDEAAGTGAIPAPLLRRWESALENVALWRFRPVITHSQLSADSIIMAHGQVSGIVDWDAVQGGDPAEDLAWLVAGAPADCVESIVEAYHMRVTESADRHLLDRATFASEFALAQWLLHGVRTRSSEVVDDARVMIADLVDALEGSDEFDVSQASVTRPAGRERVVGDTGSLPRVDRSAAGRVPTGAIAETGGIPRLRPVSATGDSDEEGGDNAQTVDDPWATLTDLVIPDYSHRRPPQPYADTPTVAFRQVSSSPRSADSPKNTS